MQELVIHSSLSKTQTHRCPQWNAHKGSLCISFLLQCSTKKKWKWIEILYLSSEKIAKYETYHAPVTRVINPDSFWWTTTAVTKHFHSKCNFVALKTWRAVCNYRYGWFISNNGPRPDTGRNDLSTSFKSWSKRFNNEFSFVIFTILFSWKMLQEIQTKTSVANKFSPQSTCSSMIDFLSRITWDLVL